MYKISIIVPITVEQKYLDKALDSLIHQTSEDFEVILADTTGGGQNGKTAKEFCDEYDGFYFVDMPNATKHEVYNHCIEISEGEYLWFFDADGYITDETVEELIKKIGDEKIDMLIMRMWLFGEHRYSEYDSSADVLAVCPNIDRGERVLLRNLDLSNKLFRRALFEARHLEFDSNPFSDGKFVIDFAMKSKHIAGCPLGVYEKRIIEHSNGFDKLADPTRENLQLRLSAWDEIFRIGAEYILAESGQVDGDEAYLTDTAYATVMDMVDNFYRYFWFLDDEFLKFFAEKYNDYANRLPKEKLESMRTNFKYICLPFIFDSQKIPVEKPFFTFLLDMDKKEEIPELLGSLYVQTAPFFELFVKESDYADDNFPERLKNVANLHVLPDKNFYAAARSHANSKICINIRDGEYLDENVLKETFLKLVPASLKPLIFAQKRKTLGVRKNLKEKGLNI